MVLIVGQGAQAGQPDSGNNSFSSEIPAIILKLEGEGTANIRKKSGILETAGARGRLLPGDRVVTDERTAVYLTLNDGTVIKVGLSSELEVEKAEEQGKSIFWEFKLLRGGARVLVERLPPAEPRLRILTPTSEVALAHGEFVVAHGQGSGFSFLYVFSGTAEFGPSGCLREKHCESIQTNQSAMLKAGKKSPDRSGKVDLTELFGLLAPEGGARQVGIETSARVSLFRDARRAAGKYTQGLDDASLRRIVDDAHAELWAAQDRVIGRTKDERDAMHDSVLDGLFLDTLDAADAFAEARRAFLPLVNGGAENLVAQFLAAKFRLGTAVREADEAGVFADRPDTPWKKRAFRARKFLDYTRSENAKRRASALEKELVNYVALLEYAEAFPGEKREEGAGAADEKDKETEDWFDQKHEPCETRSCRLTRMIHELDVMSEGVVNAFLGGKSDDKDQDQGVRGAKGTIRTFFFSRTIPGNGCFEVQKACKEKPCQIATPKKKCQKGEVAEICSFKRMPVRCPDETKK
ncbi:MAG TPA: FecR domain-containing protein [Bdellovibrionota bacterium]|jgi:hypothetical protein